MVIYLGGDLISTLPGGLTEGSIDPFNGDHEAGLQHIHLIGLPVRETLHDFRQCGTYHSVFNNNPDGVMEESNNASIKEPRRCGKWGFQLEAWES